MLDLISFNYKLYRFREEDAEHLIIYDLRKGNFFVLTGNIKNLLSRFSKNRYLKVDLDQRELQFLLKEEIIIRGANNE